MERLAASEDYEGEGERRNRPSSAWAHEHGRSDESFRRPRLDQGHHGQAACARRQDLAATVLE